MKILYVSQYFPPEMGAPAARVSELSRIWANEGHEVTVLTGFPNHPTGIVPIEYRKRLRRLTSRQRVDGVDVVRTWLWPLPNRKPHERILNYSSFSLSAAMTGMFAPRPDVVIATSPQLLVGLSGWWLARHKRVPFVFEVRDLWPESLVGVGGEKDSILYRTLKKMARFLYRAADHVVVVTPSFKEHLISNWQVPAEKISVIENGVDIDHFRPTQNQGEIREALHATGKFVVAYIGTLGMAHGLETLVEAASQLRRSAPEVLVWLIGEGAEKERIASRIRERRLQNLCLLGERPRAKIPEFISASDVCLVLLRKSEIFRTVIPTKMLEFMACGRAVIGGVDGLARGMIQKANAGIAIEPENASELADAITQLLRDPHAREAYGSNGRGYVLRNLTRQKTAEAYLNVLTCVAAQNAMLLTAARETARA